MAREIQLQREPEPPKFSKEEAHKVARHYLGLLGGCVERLAIAGSIRREKPVVKDIELVYIPRLARAKALDLFAERSVNLVDQKLEELLKAGTLVKRPNRKGFFAWGENNKLGRDVQSGIPIDFFSTTQECWWNYLVCRTGGMKSNIAICEAARAKGWKWEPYGAGFTRPPEHEGERRIHICNSEREVFSFVGLTYKEPHERE